MRDRSPSPVPPVRSRRAWLVRLVRLLGLGGAWAGLRIQPRAAPAAPLPWNTPAPLGHSGLRVTRLGFGCEEAGDAGLIRQAADRGINHFNCFPNRGDIGRFPVVGQALRPVRSRVILATGSSQRTRTGLLEDLDRQLEALGTDHVDLFYLLAVSQAETLNDDLIAALNTAREAGKIRAAALSTHGFTAVLPRLLQRTDTIHALMVTCNFASWDAGGWTEALPDIRRLRAAGVGIVAMKPLMGGLGEAPAGRNALAAALKTPTGRSRVLSAALRWVLQNELVDTVPLLIKNPAELTASTEAATRVLNEEDEKLLTTTVREASPGLCRLCPVCHAQCRLGLPVPDVMRALMYASGYEDVPRGMRAYAELAPAPDRPVCHGCPGCTAHCPHGVEVRARMLFAHNLLSNHSPCRRAA